MDTVGGRGNNPVSPATCKFIVLEDLGQKETMAETLTSQRVQAQRKYNRPRTLSLGEPTEGLKWDGQKSLDRAYSFLNTNVSKYKRKTGHMNPTRQNQAHSFLNEHVFQGKHETTNRGKFDIPASNPKMISTTFSKGHTIGTTTKVKSTCDSLRFDQGERELLSLRELPTQSSTYPLPPTILTLIMN